MLQYDVKAKYRLISGKFSGMKYFSPEHSLNQPKATRVCIRSINQSKSLYFRSFAVSVSSTRFHIKVKRSLRGRRSKGKGRELGRETTREGGGRRGTPARKPLFSPSRLLIKKITKITQL